MDWGLLSPHGLSWTWVSAPHVWDEGRFVVTPAYLRRDFPQNESVGWLNVGCCPLEAGGPPKNTEG